MEGPSLVFGALCDPLVQQLERQGFSVSDHAELMRVQIIADAVAIVTIHHLMPPSQSDRARRKLAARVGKIVRVAAPMAPAQAGKIQPQDVEPNTWVPNRDLLEG
jgi:hypothetical protein